MMSARFTYCPALGKGADLMSLLKDRVKYAQSKKMRVALTSQVAAPDGPKLQMIAFTDNLAGYEAERNAVRADPSWEAFVQKASPLLRAPVGVELWDHIVPPQTPPQEGGYVARQCFYPTIGTQFDFRAEIVEAARRLQSQGWNYGVLSRMFAPDGPVFQPIFPIKKIADWEAMGAKAMADPDIQRFWRTTGANVRQPHSADLWEVVVAPPT